MVVFWVVTPCGLVVRYQPQAFGLEDVLSARHESRRGLVSRCLCGRGKVGSAHALLMYSLPKNILLSVSQFRCVEISCSFVSE
jgi:hypothetical protein